MPIRGLYTLSLLYPASTTYMMPSTAGAADIGQQASPHREREHEREHERSRNGRTRQRGLGNIGRDDDLAASVLGRRKDLGLQICRHLRVDGQNFERRDIVDLFEPFCKTTNAKAGQRRAN